MGTCLVCSADHFLNFNFGFCEKCPAKCQACTSATVCTSCTTGYHTLPGCAACPTNCLSCTSAAVCGLCGNGFVLVSGACQACTPGSCTTCQAGAYLSAGSACLPCDPACLTCTAAGSQHCPTCAPGYQAFSGGCLGRCPSPLVGSHSICTTQCTAGQAADSRAVCQPCHSYCVTCSRPGLSAACSSCAPNYYLKGNECLAACPGGLEESDALRQCVTVTRVDWRKGWGLGMGRLGRGRGYTYPICSVGCVRGTFFSHSLGTCIRCFFGCAECNSYGFCIGCGGLFSFFFRGSCSSACPSGYLKSWLTNSCVSVSSCPASTYPDANAGACQSCNVACQTCTGPTASDCTTAAPGYTLLSSGQTRMVCSAGSYYCPATETCSTACSGSFLETTADGTAYKACPPGCAACSSATVCTACVGTAYVLANNCARMCTLPQINLNGICVDACPPNMFIVVEVSGSSNRCEACYLKCGTCLGSAPTACLSCNAPLILTSGQCVETCPSPLLVQEGKTFTCVPACSSNFVFVSGICQQCHLSCDTCSSTLREGCLSCASGLVLNSGTCELKCSLGSYLPTGQTVCAPCSPNCGSCSASGCLACDSVSLLETVTNTCVRACPIGTYKKVDYCYACTEGCTSCKSPIICHGCAAGYYKI